MYYSKLKPGSIGKKFYGSGFVVEFGYKNTVYSFIFGAKKTQKRANISSVVLPHHTAYFIIFCGVFASFIFRKHPSHLIKKRK